MNTLSVPEDKLIALLDACEQAIPVLRCAAAMAEYDGSDPKRERLAIAQLEAALRDMTLSDLRRAQVQGSAPFRSFKAA